DTWRSLLPVIASPGQGPQPSFAVSAAEQDEIAVFSLFGPELSYVARMATDTEDVAMFSDAELQRRVTGLWPRPMLERGFLQVRRSYLESQSAIRERLWVEAGDTAQVIDRQALEDLKGLGYIQD
ncbi:MAG: hypothetical protein AAF657_37410, partial [Acidobacteriota bacterium]